MKWRSFVLRVDSERQDTNFLISKNAELSISNNIKVHNRNEHDNLELCPDNVRMKLAFRVWRSEFRICNRATHPLSNPLPPVDRV